MLFLCSILCFWSSENQPIRNLPGRRITGIVVLQTVGQQSVDWFEMVILLEKLDPELTSKMLVVTSFLLAKKKSIGNRSELLRYRAVDMM